MGEEGMRGPDGRDSSICIVTTWSLMNVAVLGCRWQRWQPIGKEHIGVASTRSLPGFGKGGSVAVWVAAASRR